MTASISFQFTPTQHLGVRVTGHAPLDELIVTSEWSYTSPVVFVLTDELATVLNIGPFTSGEQVTLEVDGEVVTATAPRLAQTTPALLVRQAIYDALKSIYAFTNGDTALLADEWGRPALPWQQSPWGLAAHVVTIGPAVTRGRRSTHSGARWACTVTMDVIFACFGYADDTGHEAAERLAWRAQRLMALKPNLGVSAAGLLGHAWECDPQPPELREDEDGGGTPYVELVMPMTLTVNWVSDDTA